MSGLSLSRSLALSLSRRLLTVCLALGAVFLSTSSVHAQAQFPQITITAPEDDAEFPDGETILAQGGSTVGKEAPPFEKFHVIVINRYGQDENTHTHTGDIQETGAWVDSTEIELHGPGTWSVEVYLVSDPQIRDYHEGTVAAPE